MHKKIYTGTIALAIVFSFFVSAHKAEAATVTLSGYAWSDTIGWISFQGGGSSPYGVTVNSVTGDLSGYAWSDNVGWLVFGVKAQVQACGAKANINLATGAVTGFGRFINGNPGLGSYDGCLSLSGSSPSYGVTYDLNSRKFSGYGWGSTAVGWVSFSGASYGVITDTSLLPTPVVTITSNVATGTAGIVNPQLSWSVTNNPTSCTASGDWTGSKPTTGNNVAQGILTQSKIYTYTLTCTNAAGAGVPASATVNTGSSSCTAPTTETRQVACDMPVSSGTVTQSRTKDPANSCAWGNWVYQSDTCVPSDGTTGSFDFSVAANPGTTSVIQGDSAQTSIRVTLITGTPSPVSITFPGLPSGLSAVASSCSPTCTSTVTLTAGPSAPPVTDYVVNYTATGGGSTHSGTFKVTIVASQAINVSCIPSATSVKVGQLMTWGSTVSRGTPPYTYNWTSVSPVTGAVPSDSRAQTPSFSYSYSTIGKKTVSLTVTDSLSVTGTCAPASVQVGLNPIFQEF